MLLLLLLSHFSRVQLCATPRPWDSPGKNTGVGCHFLLQKNILEGTNSRITEVEEQINNLEDRMVEIITTEQNIEKKK